MTRNTSGAVFLSTLLLFPILLASCSDDDMDAVPVDNVPQVALSGTPITFAVEQGTAYTRAGSENLVYSTWGDNPHIPLAMRWRYATADEPVKKFYTMRNDSLVPLTDVDGFYWRSPNDSAKKVTTWYVPAYSDNDDNQRITPDASEYAVEKDQSQGLKVSDMIYCDTTITYHWPLQPYNLRYRHQVTWVTVLLATANPEVTSDKVRCGNFGSKDNLIPYKGTFTAPSGEQKANAREVYGHWTLPDSATHPEVYDSIVPLQDNTIKGLIGQYDALLIPQSIDTARVLFAMTTKGGRTYLYRPYIAASTENAAGEIVKTRIPLNLHTGLHYTFHLRVNGNGIVPDVDITDWTEADAMGGYIDVSFWDPEYSKGATATTDYWTRDEFTMGMTGDVSPWNKYDDKTGATGDDSGWDSYDDKTGATGDDSGWNKDNDPSSTTSDGGDWSKGGDIGATGGADAWQLSQLTQSAYIDVAGWIKAATGGSTAGTEKWILDE